ncbi:MAG: DUF2207 domain-containing protein [Chloroflexi bacterium]|nr:DUF2207 domain-containing protein [Chloroflexota bacterium]
MNKKFLLSALLALSMVFTLVLPVFAQDYSFAVPEVEVHVYLESDGTAAIEYFFYFENAPGAHPIDFVDVGMPGASSYSRSNVTATINGSSITDIADSPYVDGIALGLGNNAIQPGASGVVYFYIDGVRDIFYFASSESGEDYASMQFQPNYFSGDLSFGSTTMTVTLHLPPGAQDGEVVWYAPKGWPGDETPASGFDSENRIVYQWSTPNASPSGVYTFGTVFPARLIPSTAIRSEQTVTFNPSNLLGTLIPIICCGGFGGIFILVIYLSIKSAQKRKLKYLPPKIAIEGHGIKRGLTAVEAAILMEEPMDKILTMILFAALRKGAATVTSRDPLEIKVEDKLPEDMREYETAFLLSFRAEKTKRRKLLQDMMVTLVKSVGEKMKGFSRKETVEYYKEIMEKAWQQVESAETPEVRAEKYSEAVDWTMLDRDYDTRTRRTFGTGPVFMPTWWYRADPSLNRTSTIGGALKSGPTPPSGGKSTTITLPRLPGSDAAASVVNSVTAFSAGVVGNVATFTGAVTNQTNPAPKPTSSTFGSGGRSGGGGFSSGCACACACAGCACACAGGGR